MTICTYPRCKCIVSTSTTQPEPICPLGYDVRGTISESYASHADAVADLTGQGFTHDVESAKKHGHPGHPWTSKSGLVSAGIYEAAPGRFYIEYVA